ncbi:MAG: RecQ family ATP-dependent DNA helicase [bacterium]|nr:RecQ family ATP-dependent DNA helicase [bacterium]
MVEELLERCLVLDLETGQDHQVLKIGALLPGGGSIRRQGSFSLDAALDELDRHARGADFVLGHNLLGHDLRVLRSVRPGMALLTKPVVDTLYLSPLAFPKNPYHHLVKDYKLVRQSLNDPVADAKLAARLLRDQWHSFAAMPRDALAFYAFCLAGLGGEHPEGLSEVLTELAGRPPMARSRALSFVATSFAGSLCRVALHRLATGDLTDGAKRSALAYAVAWLGVADGNSVLPPWVRHRHPEAVHILAALRDVPCDDPDCLYCLKVHDPAGQLRRYFGFESFRAEPADEHGGSLQEAVTRHGLGGQPHLAILATGAGKSICYQLPALARYFRRGLLTVVISPLQALMKDQVDNLNKATGTGSAAALYGLLTPPERGAVLERVRLGDVAILYVAPEQLRNRSFRRVVEQREIGCWVLDEAHCLSKWGHDFRPDYLYAGRFIVELARSQGLPIPPVACFTATAKRDVRQGIVDYFETQLDQRLTVFESAVDRDELRFHVEPVSPAEKLDRIHALLVEHLGTGVAGSAVVYFASRRATTDAARYLERRGVPAMAFHGGMKAPDKREILEAFVEDRVRVVCATNAFGMGIDKSDVHLVIHADIPGSLESYLQEAGRAGRDRRESDCVLLFDPNDIEKQFRLSSSARLDQRDIAEILRAVRRARRREDDAVVVTSGDLLRDEETAAEIDAADFQADTKVKTAVSWLERAGLMERGENETRVFQGKLQVRSLEEAEQRLARLAPRLRLSAAERRRWLAILRALLAAEPDEGLSADELAEQPGVDWEGSLPGDSESPGQRVIRTLHSLAETGFLSSGLQLTAYLIPRGPRGAPTAYEALCALERAMLDLFAEDEPDAGDGEWLVLSLRLLNQRLLDAGHRSTPHVLRQLLRSLAEDGRGLAGSHGSLELAYSSRHRYRVRLKRGWKALREIAERRRAIGKVLLEALLARLPSEASGRTLVEFSTQDLTDAIRQDLALRGQVRDRLAAAERGLLFLHEQKVVHLQHGLAVFRQAMTIRVRPEAKGRRYTRGDYAPLEQHYEERNFQVHVMARYAALGLEKIRAALALVSDYFVLGKEDFVEQHFAGQEEVLRRATGRESYRRIVDSLGNPVQTALVAAPRDENLLVLAGPGSGKTRVVVHRCAYLLRVERVPARSVLVLCFNRNASLELRRRLRELVGEDARGVTVSTYHGLAMRLTGTSFAVTAETKAAGGSRKGPDFDSLIPGAVRLLTGDEEVPGFAADELREQILAGYSHILVDEYQDINQDQYDLVSALAGRSEADRDRRLAILAVGDDDQTIYGWRKARVEFIRRFRDDYGAKVHYLVESYRSTAHILAAAGQVIAGCRERMKSGEPIRVDRARARAAPGGRWSALDPPSGGRVQLIRVRDAAAQAAAVRDCLFHLKQLDPELDWNDCAVLARRHADLEPIRSVLEHAGVAVAWSADRDRLPTLHRVREIVTLLDTLKERRQEIRRASRLEAWLAALADGTDNPWWSLAGELLAEWREDTGDAKLTVKEAIEFLYEALAERAREPVFGDGVRLATVHAAKGLEFGAVFLPDGSSGASSAPDTDEERRLYYVGMTRAREALYLFERSDGHNPFVKDLDGDCLQRVEPRIEPPPEEVAGRRYGVIGLQDLFLSFAGSRPESGAIHRRLAALKPGDELELRAADEHLRLHQPSGAVVGALSAAGAERWRWRLDVVEWVRVLAMIERRMEDNEPAYRERLRCERWEVPVVEVAYRG